MTVLQLVSVSYFGSPVVPGLIGSLVGQTEEDWRLVIVDTSESDAEAEQLASAAGSDPRVEVARAPSNLGYFGAAHWWTTARPSTATWLAVCNADLHLADGTFVDRLARLTDPPAVLAPRITALPSGRSQNPFMVTRPSARAMLVRRLVLSHRLSASAAIRYAGWRNSRRGPAPMHPAGDIYAPHGAFTLFHQDFFTAGGTLHHRPFLFGEELTVAERARTVGLRVGYEPTLAVVHEEHQATGKRSARMFRAQREAAVYGHRLITGRETCAP
ncbi:Glycosyltransferase, GT2 family [Modestobacter sp. DSM 44400]|uniref:glycosyltransferase n=1 Tax=Modestobacter sp. DSM 44400 TaxID=1550230 RepID=UPI00089A7A36|nr:glycosyltransferase [Modestobacter sp. DSM 44400]SDY75585.1 Glycosyltransferase, GT2 family [Modestobacter sp. DSM 44400]